VGPGPNSGFFQERATGPAPTASVEHGYNPGFAFKDTVNRLLEIRVGKKRCSSGGDEGVDPTAQQGVDLHDKVFIPFQKRESHIIFE
jgi:hypothetical protein